MLLLIASLGLAAAPRAVPAPPPREGAELALAGLSIRERIIVRVQRAIRPGRPAPAPQWKEKKGPKCVPANAIAGAAIAAPQSVDVILRGGTRLRAELESACPALDYYSGFYVSPTADGRICADRDAIRDRSGSECEIERFRTLVPAK